MSFACSGGPVLWVTKAMGSVMGFINAYAIMVNSWVSLAMLAVPLSLFSPPPSSAVLLLPVSSCRPCFIVLHSLYFRVLFLFFFPSCLVLLHFT